MSLEVDLVAYNIVRISWKFLRPEALQVDHSVAALAYSYFHVVLNPGVGWRVMKEVFIVGHVFVVFCLSFPCLGFLFCFRLRSIWSILVSLEVHLVTYNIGARWEVGRAEALQVDSRLLFSAHIFALYWIQELPEEWWRGFCCFCFLFFCFGIFLYCFGLRLSSILLSLEVHLVTLRPLDLDTRARFFQETKSDV